MGLINKSYLVTLNQRVPGSSPGAPTKHQSDRGTRPDDHVVVFGERHLREVLQSYANYYNQARTHLSLNKDAPVTRSIETDGRILAVPILGGLHRRDRQPRTIAAWPSPRLCLSGTP